MRDYISARVVPTLAAGLVVWTSWRPNRAWASYACRRNSQESLLLAPKRNRRVDTRGSARRQAARDQGGEAERANRGDERRRIRRCHVVEEARDDAARCQRGKRTERHS